MTVVEKLITEQLDIWSSSVVTQSTVGRGKRSKLQLYGIKKLRELILELAVRGQLVPQDPNDEPASVLLEKIAVEKARLVKEKKIRKPKALPAITDDEKVFVLPLGWEWIHIGDIALIKGGKRIPKGHHLTEEKTNHAYIRVTNMKANTILGDDLLYLTSETQKIIKQYTISSNDLYITIAGTIGDVGIVPPEFNGMNLTENAAKLVFNILNRFWLKETLNSQFIQKQFAGKTNKLAQPKLALHRISTSILALPPLAEQHRIVAKVNELMSLCDTLEQAQESSIDAHQTLIENLLNALTHAADQGDFDQAWTRIAAHFDTLFTTEHSIDQLKQTILQLAVMGKLVTQDPEDEPASVLLAKIAAEKAQLIKAKKIKKQKVLPPIKEEEKPFELPERWEWCRVWDIAKLITSGSRDWAKYYSDNGAIFITMGNLSRGDYKLRLNSIRYVRLPKTREGSRTKLNENDLLISITGDVGNLGLIPKDFGEAYINQHTCLLRFMPDCRNRFFPELMRSPLAKYQFDAPQRGIKNSFRLGDIGEMIIPIPPTKEQKRIVKKVDQLLSLCDQLKSQITSAKTTQQRLADVLTRQTTA